MPTRPQRRLAPSVASSRFSSGTSKYRDHEYGPRQWSSDEAGSVNSFRMESYDIGDYTTVKRRNNGKDHRMAPSTSKGGSRQMAPANKGSVNKGSSGKAGNSTGSSKKPASKKGTPLSPIQCRPPSPRPTLKEFKASEPSIVKHKMSHKVPKHHKIINPPLFPSSVAASKTSKKSAQPRYPKAPASLASQRVVHKTLKPFPSMPSAKTHSSLGGGVTPSVKTTRSAKTSTSAAPSTKTYRTSTSEPCSPRHVKWKLPTLNTFRSKDSAEKDENLQPIPLALLEKGKKKKNSKRSLLPWTNPRNAPPNRPKPKLQLLTATEAPLNEETQSDEEEAEAVRVNADEEGDDDDGHDFDGESAEDDPSEDSPGPPTHIAHRKAKKMSFTKRFLMRKAEENEVNSHGSKKSKSSQKHKSRSEKNTTCPQKSKQFSSRDKAADSVKSKSSSKKTASSGKKTGGGERVDHDLENNSRALVPRGVSPKRTTLLHKENEHDEQLGLVQLPHPGEENAAKKQPPAAQLKQLTIEDARDLLGDKDSVKIFSPNPNANIVLSNLKPKNFRWHWRERKPRQKLQKINKAQLQKWLEFAQGAIDEAYIEGVVEADSSLSSYYSNSDLSETGISHILEDVGVEDVRQLFAEAQGHVTFADTTTLATLATDDARSISSVEIMFNWLTCNHNDDEMQFEVRETKDVPTALNMDDHEYNGAIVFHKGAKSSAVVSTIVACAPITHCL